MVICLRGKYQNEALEFKICKMVSCSYGNLEANKKGLAVIVCFRRLSELVLTLTSAE